MERRAGLSPILAPALALALIPMACARTPDGAPGDGAFPPGEPVALLAPGVTPAELELRVMQFAPAVLDFDDTSLEPWERKVLAKLIQASDVMHEIFAQQVSPRTAEWWSALARAGGAGQEAALAYFDIMVGPWDRLEHNAPFLDVGPKPAGAGFYPPDLTGEELDAWVAAHPEDAEAFTGYFTVIRREGGRLVAVPYSEAYRPQLERAAALLREAADLAEEPTLARYLRSRADAFLSDDYFQSDMDWMDVASRIEPTIGPYEVYEDGLRGYKAAFESFVTVADPAASAALDELKGHLRALEQALPIEDRYKNLERGFESPIRVVDLAYSAGDTRAGVQTIAFNLPNDERVREAKGSKKVMLRNVAHAKFDRILSPIAQEVLVPATAAQIAFEPWFTNVLMHELAHGLGPGNITLENGEQTTVNRALRERYSAIEEAKADVTGLHSMSVLQQKGVFTADFVRRAYASHTADLFRAVRFGAGEAHGMANLVQFNWFREKGVITLDEATGRFRVDLTGMVAANRELARELLTLQARGSYERAGEILERYGKMDPAMQAAVDRLGSVPVDIRPRYAARLKMQEW